MRVGGATAIYKSISYNSSNKNGQVKVRIGKYYFELQTQTQQAFHLFACTGL